MFLTGFTLPILGVILLVFFYSLVATASIALFFWLPGEHAVSLGSLLVVMVILVSWRWALRPWMARVRGLWGGPLAAFRMADLPRVGSKAAYLAALQGSCPVPPGYLLPRSSLWLCHRLLYRWLLRPRLRRFLDLHAGGEVIVRSSVPSEDQPGSGVAGRYRSIRLSSSDPSRVLEVLRQLQAELRQAGPYSILLQPCLSGPLTLVSSYDPVTGRDDLIRLEVYADADGACTARTIERWSAVEQRSRSAGAIGILLRCEQVARAPVVLELVGRPPSLVQVRELKPLSRETYAVGAFVQGGSELLPENVDSATLNAAITKTLRGPALVARVERHRLYFRVRDQFELFARRPWYELLWTFARAEQRARAARGEGNEFLIVHLLYARALFGLLQEVGRQLDVGSRRVNAALAGLTLDPALLGSRSSSVPVAAEGRWVPGLVPWREIVEFIVARLLAHRVAAYLDTRSRLTELRPADPALPAALYVDGDRAVALPSGELATVPIQPGSTTGTLRILRAPEQVSRVAEGDVVWARFDHAWLREVLPRAGAVLLEHGGALSHIALNCVARSVPCASGVALGPGSHQSTSAATDPGGPAKEFVDGARVHVEIDDGGCTVAAVPEEAADEGHSAQHRVPK